MNNVIISGINKIGNDLILLKFKQGTSLFFKEFLIKFMDFDNEGEILSSFLEETPFIYTYKDITIISYVKMNQVLIKCDKKVPEKITKFILEYEIKK